MKYARLVIESYSSTAAAAEAKVLLEEWKAAEPFREWTDITGKFKSVEKFVRLVKGTVTLQRKDGTTHDLPLAKLSRFDQQYVHDREGK